VIFSCAQLYHGFFQFPLGGTFECDWSGLEWTRMDWRGHFFVKIPLDRFGVIKKAGTREAREERLKRPARSNQQDRPIGTPGTQHRCRTTAKVMRFASNHAASTWGEVQLRGCSAMSRCAFVSWDDPWVRRCWLRVNNPIFVESADHVLELCKVYRFGQKRIRAQLVGQPNIVNVRGHG